MNRRNFLSLFSAGVAGLALEQAIPLGRVWSFPKEIVIAKRALNVDDFFEQGFPVGTTMHLRIPGRFLAFDYSYAAIRENGWRFPTEAFPPDNSRTPS
jgi:hypothetical protein